MYKTFQIVNKMKLKYHILMFKLGNNSFQYTNKILSVCENKFVDENSLFDMWKNFFQYFI